MLSDIPGSFSFYFPAPNNSFQPTGISVPLIESLDAARRCFPAAEFGR
jgi:hypothetical protein